MKEFERRFAEPFSSYRNRPLQLVDGIDIVKALASMGLADRRNVASAVQDSVRSRDEQRPPSLQQPVAKALKEAARKANAHRDDGDEPMR